MGCFDVLSLSFPLSEPEREVDELLLVDEDEEDDDEDEDDDDDETATEPPLVGFLAVLGNPPVLVVSIRQTPLVLR